MGETAVKKKRPFSFYVCSLAFTFERFAFYGTKWLLAVFVVASVADGGLGLTAVEGAKISSNLVAATYIAPVIGSFISDRFIGAKYLVPVGMILMGFGYLLGTQADSVAMINIMILLISLGTGLFKCQTNGITGRLFEDPRDLDGAFCVQYSFVNFGSFFGTTIIGVVAATSGYSVCFLLCAILMFIDAIWFIAGWKALGEVGAKPFKIDERKEEKVAEVEPFTTNEKKRIAAIVLVSAFSTIFWLFWYLAYMPVYYHWDAGAANWMIGSFQVPSAWFDSLNAFCCITMGPLLSMLWAKLAARPKGDMSMFKKTALGMLLLGAAYLIFALAEVMRGENMASLLWIVAFGVVLSLGEMVFSPLGNSFISKFSPARILSLMLSVWVFSVFIAAKTYGDLYAFTLNFDFAASCVAIAAVAIVAGIILGLLDKKLSALVED